MKPRVFTCDGVGVGIVNGVVRALMTLRKSKFGVVSGVISATESESEESKRFNFLQAPVVQKLDSTIHPDKSLCSG